ncbi:helix-hairpin-helix domain-containing protein [Hydrogenimonas sp.]
MDRTAVEKELQKIPGVGRSLSRDLADLGYRKVEDLEGENPEAMYRNLTRLRGRHIDRCVLYVFRCAVYFASHTRHDPALLKWWNWKEERPGRS